MTSELPYGVPVDVGGDLGLAVRLVLDETCPSDILIDAATTALVEGLDSPSLRELAGLPKRDAPYCWRLADRALEELGLTVAESSAANRAAARSWARALLDDRARPFVAVDSRLWLDESGVDALRGRRTPSGATRRWSDDLGPERTPTEY